MPKTSLSSAQRVNRMLQRQDHDRVPRHDNYWPETIERWLGEGMPGTGHDDALRLLGSDFHQVGWCWPKPFPGRSELVSEDEQTRTSIDAMGNTQRLAKHTSTTPEHVAFGCQTAEDWRDVYKPALLAHSLQVDAAASRLASQRGRQNGRWTFLAGIESVTGIHQLVGDETALIAAATEPEWISDMAATYTDLLLSNYQHLADEGVQADGLWAFGDVAYNHGPFFSPAMYRQFYMPQHRRMADWAHAHGMKFIYHTDGDVRLLLDSFIEAGVDCLQPLEAKAGMDIRSLLPRYGQRLSFFGNIDMTVAITNDPQRVEAELLAKLKAGMQTRGYCYHSDHSVPPQVQWKTYRRIIELLDAHGCY